MADPSAQAVGGCHFAAGHPAPRRAVFHATTATAGGPAGLAGAGSQGIACLAVCIDAGVAVAGVGDDLGIRRAGDAQQLIATALDRAGQCAGVCVPAQGPRVSGVPDVSDRITALGGSVVSRLGT